MKVIFKSRGSSLWVMKKKKVQFFESWKKEGSILWVKKRFNSLSHIETEFIPLSHIQKSVQFLESYFSKGSILGVIWNKTILWVKWRTRKVHFFESCWKKFNSLSHTARSKISRWSMTWGCNTGRDNRLWQFQYMDDVSNTLLRDSHWDADGYREVSCQQVSWVRSICAKSRPMIRNVLSPPTHNTTNALIVSVSECNVISKKTWLEQHFRVTDRRNKGYRVSTCRLALTFVSAFNHCSVLIVQRGITTNIKHILPAPSSRHRLQWRLVEDMAYPHSS